MKKAFTLLEIVMIIIIMGVLSTIGLRSIYKVIETAKFNATVDEMNRIKIALIGNSHIKSGTIRTYFGYFGKFGNNKNLNWSTLAKFMHTDEKQLSTDAWGKKYYINWKAGNNDEFALYAQKSGNNYLYKVEIAKKLGDLQNLSLSGYVKDSYGATPINSDLSNIEITITEECGTTLGPTHPSSGGYFTIKGLSIGNHKISVKHTALNQLIEKNFSLEPAANGHIEIIFTGHLPGTRP